MSSPLSLLPYLLPDDTDVHGFSGYTILAIMAWIAVILSLIAFFPIPFHLCHRRPSPPPNIDIELDDCRPRVSQRTALPAIHIHHCITTSHLSEAKQHISWPHQSSTPTTQDRPAPPVKVYGARPVVLNNVSVLDLRGSNCHGHASWGAWTGARVRHWGL